MNDYLPWLLLGFGLCVLAVWLGYRAIGRADLERQSEQLAADAAAKAAAQRLAAEEAAARVRQRAAAQEAARAEAKRLAQAEAARADAARRAAEESERTARLAAAQAAQAEAARAESEKALRAEAARVATAEAAHVQAARKAAQATAHYEAERDKTAAASAPQAGAVAAITAERTLVMIVDDSKIVRIKTGRLLEQHQYRVAYAVDGLDAANQLQSSIPDVMITDVEMPGMDGFELTHWMRENPLTANIPIIMITGTEHKYREQASRAGVNAMLGKPYPEDELIAQVRLAMRQREAQSSALA